MKSNNSQGNPYHDESGKFTSGDGASSGKGNPKHDNSGSFSKPVKEQKAKSISDILKDYGYDVYDPSASFAPKKQDDYEQKMSKMGFGPDEKEKVEDPKSAQNRSTYNSLASDPSKQLDFVNSIVDEIHNEMNNFNPSADNRSEESQHYKVDKIIDKLDKNTGTNFEVTDFQNVYGGSDSEGSWSYPTYTLENDQYEVKVSFSGGYKQAISLKATPKEQAEDNLEPVPQDIQEKGITDPKLYRMMKNFVAQNNYVDLDTLIQDWNNNSKDRYKKADLYGVLKKYR